jgi:hypothetical protein
MTQAELLRIIISQAKSNGFAFRQWFQKHIRPAWPGTTEALNLLCSEKRYYALLFSHEFARAFWNKGAQMTFVVPAASYTRRNAQGEIITVARKAFTRRTIKPDVWRYHLRQMATTEDPLRYIRRFLLIEEDLGRRPTNGANGPNPL